MGLPAMIAHPELVSWRKPRGAWPTHLDAFVVPSTLGLPLTECSWQSPASLGLFAMIEVLRTQALISSHLLCLITMRRTPPEETPVQSHLGLPLSPFWTPHFLHGAGWQQAFALPNRVQLHWEAKEHLYLPFSSSHQLLPQETKRVSQDRAV